MFGEIPVYFYGMCGHYFNHNTVCPFCFNTRHGKGADR